MDSTLQDKSHSSRTSKERTWATCATSCSGTRNQVDLVKELQDNKKSLVITGDFGGGKSSLLIAAAKKEATNNDDSAVYFIPAYSSWAEDWRQTDPAVYLRRGSGKEICWIQSDCGHFTKNERRNLPQRCL